MKSIDDAVRSARVPASVSAVLLGAAVLLGGCASGYQSEYNGASGKVLLVSKSDWADFQKYLANIGSTRDGAFAMGVTNGHSDGWASSSCGYDVCYGGGAATNAMSRCRAGGECVLFATDNHILVNYKVADE